MKFWQLFWEVSLIVSGTAFAFITAVVTIKGFRDIRNMFQALVKQRESSEDQ